jgi:hypothetical protein
LSSVAALGDGDRDVRLEKTVIQKCVEVIAGGDADAIVIAASARAPERYRTPEERDDVDVA